MNEIIYLNGVPVELQKNQNNYTILVRPNNMVDETLRTGKNFTIPDYYGKKIGQVIFNSSKENALSLGNITIQGSGKEISISGDKLNSSNNYSTKFQSLSIDGENNNFSIDGVNFDDLMADFDNNNFDITNTTQNYNLGPLPMQMYFDDNKVSLSLNAIDTGSIRTNDPITIYDEINGFELSSVDFMHSQDNYLSIGLIDIDASDININFSNIGNNSKGFSANINTLNLNGNNIHTTINQSILQNMNNKGVDNSTSIDNSWLAKYYSSPEKESLSLNNTKTTRPIYFTNQNIIGIRDDLSITGQSKIRGSLHLDAVNTTIESSYVNRMMLFGNDINIDIDNSTIGQQIMGYFTKNINDENGKINIIDGSKIGIIKGLIPGFDMFSQTKDFYNQAYPDYGTEIRIDSLAQGDYKFKTYVVAKN